jgi:NifB/MoaA-like Fe-S oxidoreductase
VPVVFTTSSSPAREGSATKAGPQNSAASGAAPVRAREPVTIITGEYGAAVLHPLAAELADAAGVPVAVRPVANRFFGGNIAVTGLLTGVDVAGALTDVDPRSRVLLPDVVLSNGRFLDGSTPADLPRPVEVVATDGASLVRALRNRA